MEYNSHQLLSSFNDVGIIIFFLLFFLQYEQGPSPQASPGGTPHSPGHAPSASPQPPHSPHAHQVKLSTNLIIVLSKLK